MLVIQLRHRDGALAGQALLDDDFEHLSGRRWCLHEHGTAVGTMCNRQVYLARVVLDCPAGGRVVFLNGNKLDCRRDNLRWRESTKRTHRQHNLWYTYRITEDEYDAMLDRQNGFCRICGKECSTGRKLAVDHCHATDCIRGLLCFECNIGIGKFGDNPDLLLAAARYLKEEACLPLST